MKQILWIGPIVNPREVKKYKAISPAANSWQSSLINALRTIGCDVEILSYIPEPIFPMGKLFMSHNKIGASNSNLLHVSYVNLPGIRNFFLACSLKKTLRNKKKYDVLITYNCSDVHVRVGKYLKEKYNILWVSIVADDLFIYGPDLTVFLSYNYFKKAKLENKLHLDGGINEIVECTDRTEIEKGKRIILFSGALNKWTGIEDFTKLFIKINNPEFTLEIYGKGESVFLSQLAAECSNVILKGFVSDAELDLARRSAFAFVNPRPIDIPNGEKNFPSKLLEYLQYGKPIISSQTIGLAPYYDDLLIYYDPKNESSLRTALNQINNMTPDIYSTIKQTIEHFAINHTWINQANKLINAISKLKK